MDKWKIGVIVLLFAALAGYGVLQNSIGQENHAGEDATEKPHDAHANDNSQERVRDAEELLRKSEASNRKLIGQPCPAWVIQQKYWVNTTKPVTLKDLKGSYAVIELWRSKCENCQKSKPFTKRIYELYSELGLKWVSFHSASAGDADENNWSKVQEKIEEYSLPYPVAFDEGAYVFRTAFQLHSFPTHIIIDPNGIVRHAQSGYTYEKAQSLVLKLNELLKVKPQDAKVLIDDTNRNIGLPSGGGSMGGGDALK